MGGREVRILLQFVGKTNLVIGLVAGNLNVFPAGANLMQDSDLAEMFMPNQGAFSPAAGIIPEAV